MFQNKKNSYKPNFILVRLEEEQKKRESKYYFFLIIILILGILSYKIFNFALILYISTLFVFLIPLYLAYKNHELNFINTILFLVLLIGFIVNIFTDEFWSFYLIFGGGLGLLFYDIFQQETKLSTEQKNNEFKTIFYDIWKKQAELKGIKIDKKEDEFYKKEHNKFNTINTLTVILPFAIFSTLKNQIGFSEALFVGIFYWFYYEIYLLKFSKKIIIYLYLSFEI